MNSYESIKRFGHRNCHITAFLDCYTCNKVSYFEGLDIEGLDIEGLDIEGLDIEGLDIHRNQL